MKLAKRIPLVVVPILLVLLGLGAALVGVYMLLGLAAALVIGGAAAVLFGLVVDV